MSVYQKNDKWHYDFWLKGERHTSRVGLETKGAAADAEQVQKRTLRRRAMGLESEAATDTPRFTDWAVVTFRWQVQRKRLKRPDGAKLTLRMILAFWGERPRKKPVDGGVYRNLRLGDPIERPELIGEFEAWMTARGLSGARKNHYRSACSMIYRVALLPENRRRSGVTLNPFSGVLRDRAQRRTAVPEVDDLMAWLKVAPLPVAIGVGLGLLSPALRLRNVVDLRRKQISKDLSVLTVPHKADRETGLPLTVVISPGLRRILKQVFALHPKDPYVVPIEGERYWQFQKLVKSSLLAAGLPYGRKRADGLTFHSLRHAVSTWLARWRVSAVERQRALAHETSAMSDWYSHLGGIDMAPTMRMIDRRVPVADVLEARLDAALAGEKMKRVPPKSRRRAAVDRGRKTA